MCLAQISAQEWSEAFIDSPCMKPIQVSCESPQVLSLSFGCCALWRWSLLFCLFHAACSGAADSLPLCDISSWEPLRELYPCVAWQTASVDSSLTHLLDILACCQFLLWRIWGQRYSVNAPLPGTVKSSPWLKEGDATQFLPFWKLYVFFIIFFFSIQFSRRNGNEYCHLALPDSGHTEW